MLTAYSLTFPLCSCCFIFIVLLLINDLFYLFKLINYLLFALTDGSPDATCMHRTIYVKIVLIALI